MDKEVVDRIRRIRVSRRISQQAMADMLDISIGAYSNLERHESALTVTRLYEIADYFEMSVYDFLPPNKNLSIVSEPSPTNDKILILEKQMKLLQEEMAAIRNPKEVQKPKRRNKS